MCNAEGVKHLEDISFAWARSRDGGVQIYNALNNDLTVTFLALWLCLFRCV
jgi:hypothetical protein